MAPKAQEFTKGSMFGKQVCMQYIQIRKTEMDMENNGMRGQVLLAVKKMKTS